MQTIPVLVTLDFTDDHLDILRSVSDRLLVRRVSTRDAEGLAAALDEHPDTQVLYTIAMPDAWSDDWSVEWVQLHSAGADHVDFETVPPDVRLTTGSGVHASVLTEHTFALLLALHRRVPRMVDLQRESTWAENRWTAFSRPLVRGQTMAILGYGAIGREIARVAQAFGMRVLAYKRDPRRTEQTGFRPPGTGDADGSIPAAYYGPDELHEVLGASDVVVNVLPATPETDKLLDADAFEAMKPGALFVNVGRGSSVDEAALVDALEGEHLGGAALDVFAEEPLPAESPLWDVENLIISPHVGGMFLGYDDAAAELFRENLERYVSGEPLLNEIDRELGY